MRPVVEPGWGKTTWVDSVELGLGGNGGSASYTLAKLSTRVRLLSALGLDDFGANMLTRLESAGVDTRWVLRSPDLPTAVTVGLVNPNGSRGLLMNPGVSRQAFASSIDLTAGLVAGCGWFHLANLFALPAFQPHAANVLRHARGLGLQTSVDTGWDAQGRWMEALAPCLPHTDLLFVNEDEARQLTGIADVDGGVAALQQAGASDVVVKLGSAGCLVVTRAEHFTIPGFLVDAIDTTGAGDCFGGGFLAALQRGFTYPECARFANAVGALSVQSLGAVSGLRSFEETISWMDSQTMNPNPSRRAFLQTAGALAPAILGAEDKAGSKRTVIGSGEFTYEVIHDWGELPSNIRYGNTHGVVQDSQGRMYVHHTVNVTSESSDSMVVFDEKGKFIKSWGKDFKGGAHGLHLQKEGSTEFLYLCDITRGLVVKATLDGEEVFRLGYPREAKPYEANIKYSPTNLATAPNGDIYVGDGYGSSYVNQYDKTGRYIRTFGGPGSDPGQLLQPHGIWMDTRGAEPVLTVADRRNNRLQTFTLDGEHRGFVHGVNLPCHFSTRKDLMVIPDLAARVTLLDRNNQVILHLGEGPTNYREIRTKSRDAFPIGAFVCPHGACFDHDGNIFVVEWVEIGRVTKLRKVA